MCAFVHKTFTLRGTIVNAANYHEFETVRHRFPVFWTLGRHLGFDRQLSVEVKKNV
jgi:hypothetical protein